MALVNAFINTLIEENLYNREFVENYSEGFEKMRELVSKYTPENTAEITGLDPKMVREAVRMSGSRTEQRSGFLRYGSDSGAIPGIPIG